MWGLGWYGLVWVGSLVRWLGWFVGWVGLDFINKRDPDSKRHAVFRIIYVFFGIFIVETGQAPPSRTPLPDCRIPVWQPPGHSSPERPSSKSMPPPPTHRRGRVFSANPRRTRQIGSLASWPPPGRNDIAAVSVAVDDGLTAVMILASHVGPHVQPPPCESRRTSCR